MGKSDKKIKSDRINALKKQYDAFLEEDKRRRERNEYILGRLDKMRYCTTMVPMRAKPSIFVDRKDNISMSLGQPDHSSTLSPFHDKNLPLDIQRKQSDETSLLREISKKYILIPKVRSAPDTINAHTVKPSFEDTGDWKSKYDILDQLKRDEIESDISHHRNEYKVTKNANATIQENYNENYDLNAHGHNTESSKLVHKYELPERENGIKESYESLNPEQTYINNEHQLIYDDPEDITGHQNDIQDIHKEKPQARNSFDFDLPEKHSEHNNTNEQILTTQNINEMPDLQTNSKLDYNNSIEHVEVAYNTENDIVNEDPHFEPVVYNNQHITTDEDKDIINDTEKKNYLNEKEIVPVEVIQPDDFMNEINASAPAQEIPEVQDIEDPGETNMQDFIPDSDVQIQDGDNINPTYPAVQESYDPTYEYDSNSQVVAENTTNENEMNDTSGIEAFEAEQKNMFYSEQTNENYAYNSQEVDENYDQDYKTQNDEYMQNQEAVYYDGAETDQQYPVDIINEHEETTQLYDQNYEQQYGGAYTEQYQQEGYEQQENTQQYEPEIVDQTQQGIEQLNFDEQYNATEEVKQQLDGEEGYIVTQDQHLNDVQATEQLSEQQIADVETS